MIRSALIFLLVLSFNVCFAAAITGQQPHAAVDVKGTVRVVYGAGEKIFCITSTNNGLSFSKPALVGQVKTMYLGHTRGPQIASSRNYSMITAIDKAGKIHSFKLNHLKNSWTRSAAINDKAGSAIEGLMSVTADRDDNFYAAWLDLRLGKEINIFSAAMNGKAASWSKNVLVYQSPDDHTCECCKPNIVFNNGKLVIGFRNWLMGSRDIYYTVSKDKGKTFGPAQKSGQGTWQLNACPMDGGGLAISDKGVVSAAWRRNSEVFFASGNQPEQKIAAGRDVNMAQRNGKTMITWQHDNKIRVMNIKDRKTMTVGQGQTPELTFLANGKVLCVWEEEKQVKYKVI